MFLQQSKLGKKERTAKEKQSRVERLFSYFCNCAPIRELEELQTSAVARSSKVLGNGCQGQRVQAPDMQLWSCAFQQITLHCRSRRAPMWARHRREKEERVLTHINYFILNRQCILFITHSPVVYLVLQRPLNFMGSNLNEVKCFFLVIKN